MSKNVAMFVDVANIYYAARGQDLDVDYVAMLKHATKGRDLIRAYAYSGLDPENENQRKFIDFLGKNGYKVMTKDIRKFGDGRVKANLDIELVVDLFRLADRMDIAVIVSGDGDFAPAIRALQDKGVRCEVISFKPNTSSDLIAVADEFIDIQKIAGIGRKKGEGSRAEAMSMPEMPAKEVVPEFGFREASPSVAAAALAALKGGGSGRGNGRSGRRAQPSAPAEAAEAGTATAAADEADETKRRRRRRGGRGRGRGRRDEAEPADAASTAEVTGEPGWQEFDDLAELEGLGEEREYSFSEADPATLRELGLLDATEAADAAPSGEALAGGAADASTADAAEAEEKPKRTRRRSGAAAAEPATEGDVSGAAAEKPKRTRRRRTTTAGDEATQAAAAKPTRRRSTRTKATDATDAPVPEAGPDSAEASADAPETPRRRRAPRRRAATSEGAGDEQSAASDGASPAAGDADALPAGDEQRPQGIWGRFRSGRG